jgi:THO complex subunit 2
MSSFSLPTSTEIQGAARSDSNRCQKLVLQAIEYGTNESDTLEERTSQACNVLGDAWENCIDLEDVLSDVLWLKGSMLSSTDSSSAKKAFAEILKYLVQIPRETFFKKLQGNLQPGLVETCGLGLEQELLKKLKVHNTQVHYKQHKYNLLQEESEGYSKALHFLVSQDINDPVLRRAKLLQLIGTFELDPNRLMDLTMDILEQKLFPNGVVEEIPSTRPQSTHQITWILEIMKEFSIDTKLQSLISFKLSSDKKPSQTLLGTIAFLSASNLLDLTTLAKTFLDPVENEIQEAHQVFSMKEKKRIQGLSRISLSGTTKENPEVAKLTERLDKRLMTLRKNACLQILIVMLEWGEWNLAKPVLPSDCWSQLCTLLPEKIGDTLCTVAEHILQPWYDSKVGSPGLSKPWKVNDIEARASDISLDEAVHAVSDPLLYTARSAWISSRPILFHKLCRLFGCLLSEAEAGHEISNETYNFFQRFLIPSLSLFPSNPALSTELWAVLELLPYATRYRLYDDWRGAGLGNAGLSMSATGKPFPNVESEIQAGKAARYVLKRLSRDNIREMSRQLSKVTHSNPLVVFTTILQQIESYDNMVEVMVEAQRFVNPLGLDVLGYCILSRLSGTTGGVNRSRLKGMRRMHRSSMI